MVIIIHIWFGLTGFRKDFSVCMSLIHVIRVVHFNCNSPVVSPHIKQCPHIRINYVVHIWQDMSTCSKNKRGLAYHRNYIILYNKAKKSASPRYIDTWRVSDRRWHNSLSMYCIDIESYRRLLSFFLPKSEYENIFAPILIKFIFACVSENYRKKKFLQKKCLKIFCRIFYWVKIVLIFLESSETLQPDFEQNRSTTQSMVEIFCRKIVNIRN